PACSIPRDHYDSSKNVRQHEGLEASRVAVLAASKQTMKRLLDLGFSPSEGGDDVRLTLRQCRPASMLSALGLRRDGGGYYYESRWEVRVPADVTVNRALA